MWGEAWGELRWGCRAGPGGLLPPHSQPGAVVPVRWLPSVPRRVEEPSEDFALRVQEVGWSSARWLQLRLYPQERVGAELQRVILDGCIWVMGALAPVYCQ